MSVPLLPGHGRTWTHLNHTTWQQWYAQAEEEFLWLRSRCDTVFVAGLSMGGALAVRLAETYGEDVAGLMLVNPALTAPRRRAFTIRAAALVAHSAPALGDDIRLPGQTDHSYPRTPLHAAVSMLELWKIVTADLPRVHQPLLIFHSAHDRVIDNSSLILLTERTHSCHSRTVQLPHSGHVATLDYDAQRIHTESVRFIKQLCS
ncbi:Thermostable monoacylglycerol lipase [Corynebacterium ciconiae DSM 44920]|nr:Thermostable monoacylglycerol lipase [Corynebacterium ciconiae DSM 44920]